MQENNDIISPDVELVNMDFRILSTSFKDALIASRAQAPSQMHLKRQKHYRANGSEVFEDAFTTKQKTRVTLLKQQNQLRSKHCFSYLFSLAGAVFMSRCLHGSDF